jgi:hypothetical protein
MADSDMYIEFLDLHMLKLESTDVNIRTMAGENIALMINQKESKHINQKEFFYHRQEELLSLLESLSRGNNYLKRLDSTPFKARPFDSTCIIQRYIGFSIK